MMIGAILLQSGKGAEIGAAFGGSSQTIFGSRGATTFLSKMTVGAAIIFMVTSLSLAFLSKERASEASILKSPKVDTAPIQPATATAPSTPAPSGATATPAAPAAAAPPSIPAPEKK
jgi:preprotein translocase subunit SecG